MPFTLPDSARATLCKPVPSCGLGARLAHMFDDGGMAGKVARVHALLADVAAGITAETSGPAAREALVEAVAAGRQLDLVVCLLTDRVERSGQFAEDGSVSMAAWLRTEAHASHGWALARVHAGRALRELPATKAAWEAGDLGLEHVAVIRKAAEGLAPAQVGSLDRALAAAAPQASPRDLAHIAAVIREELAPGDCQKDRDRRQAAQRVHLSDVPDGGRLDGDLDAESTAIVRAALEKYMPKPTPTIGEDGTVGPPLTASHRRALALVEMARQALDFGSEHPGSANKPHLIVSMSADRLRDQTGVGYLPGGGTLPAADLRRMACDAKVIPLVLGSDSLPLDVGRKTRTIPSWIRTALNERDKGCRHPRCDRPPAYCDAHHVTHWIDGGETKIDNLVLLCRTHHRQHHKGEFRIRALSRQRFVFTKATVSSRT